MPTRKSAKYTLFKLHDPAANKKMNTIELWQQLTERQVLLANKFLNIKIAKIANHRFLLDQYN